MNNIDFVFISSWFGGGLVGMIILWRVMKYTARENMTWCPSPRAIVLIALGSSMGPIVLLVSLIIASVEYNFWSDDNWFVRPICKSKEDNE